MKPTFSLLFVLISYSVLGNINFISFDKIPDYKKYFENFNFLIENEPYFDHWQPEWTYEINKKALVESLKSNYEVFSKLDNSNFEINLILGDISHFLYNLHEDEYFDSAINFYKKAIEIDPKNYRAYWFLANHYALANIQEESIVYFLEGEKLLPENEPANFWEEYAFATAVANMPSHCIFAMDKAKSILGEPSYFEEQLGQSIYNRIVPVNKDSTYNFKDIWTASEGELITFISRPLGIKMLIDPTWQINFYNYENHQTFVTMVPPALTNKSGREITYTIALIIKVAGYGENIESFVNKFISKYPDRNEFDISSNIEGLISYEIKDKDMYQEIGGAHMHMVGVGRDRPQYAGLLLEQPMSIPQGENKEINYYRASDSKDRFDGEIFYAIMLDACEDIYPEAYKLFIETLEDQIIME